MLIKHLIKIQDLKNTKDKIMEIFPAHSHRTNNMKILNNPITAITINQYTTMINSRFNLKIKVQIYETATIIIIKIIITWLAIPMSKEMLTVEEDAIKTQINQIIVKITKVL